MTLSIIIPTFNSERTLEQCLQAIQSSSYQDRELIVVDDGSAYRRSRTNRLRLLSSPK